MMSKLMIIEPARMSSGNGAGPMSARDQAELVLSVLVFGSVAALLLAFGPVGLMG